MRIGKIAPISTEHSASHSIASSAILPALLFLFLAAPAQAKNVLFDHEPQPMPSLVYEDAEGLQHTLSELKGKFVLLNLWATWCVTCATEMPSLDALQAQFGQELVVLPLAQNQTDMSIKAFYQTNKIEHLPVAIDKTGRATFLLKIRGLPTTVFIGKDGQELARLEGGFPWGAEPMQAFLRQEMAR